MTATDMGDSDKIRPFVVDVLADVADATPGEILDSTRLVEDLGIDSIDLVEIAQRIEDGLGLVLSDGELVRASVVETVGALISTLRLKESSTLEPE